MDISRTIQVVTGIAHTAYGIGLKDKRDFSDPFAFDAYDMWFGADFEYILDELLDDFLDDIETDISSVDSTNLSEQHSEQISQQSSADRRAKSAAGLTHDTTSAISSDNRTETGSRISTPDKSGSNTTQSSSTTSVQSASDTTPSHEHSHAGGWRHDDDAESTFSGVSWSDVNDDHHTGLSHSEGTSQQTGEASTLSSVSIEIESYNDIWANTAESDEKLTISLGNPELRKKHNADSQQGFDMDGVGGVEWTGDMDHEQIFGTRWLDTLLGGFGDDELRGLEGNDILWGGAGSDKLWGDGGDDVIYTSYKEDDPDVEADNTLVPGSEDEDFASGGSGNDKLYGFNGSTGIDEHLFGGTGNDQLFGYRGEDYLHGGAGHDKLDGGRNSDELLGGAGDDKLYGRGGRDDLDGGSGEDEIIAGKGNDDAYGGEGDDIIRGGPGADDLFGGEGEDRLYGGNDASDSDSEGDVLRGGAGDDILVLGDQIDGSSDSMNHKGWVYGGEGDDALFGQSKGKSTFLWAGAGDDYVRGADAASVTQKINGNDGDDFIRRGSSNEASYVRGGKGDDTIGKVEWNEDDQEWQTYRAYYYGEEDEIVRQAMTADNIGNDDSSDHRGDKENKTDLVYGEQGDDEIWGSSETETKSLLDGGLGDDKLYLGWQNAATSKSRILGGSGKDIIRTDIWNRGAIDGEASLGDVYLFGDYEYGPEDLDKDLWGSADSIFNGKGTGMNDAFIYGGDGGDTIHSGNVWDTNQVYGQNGDDTIYLSQGSESVEVFGGSGHDTIVNVADYGSVESQDVPYNKQEVISGGAGNDLIRGTHGVDSYGTADDADGTQIIHGDDGEDKIYGGDGVDSYQRLAGGDGDDWVVGGDSTDDQYLYGDQRLLSSFDAFDYYDELKARDGFYIMNASGDDVLYGGDFTGSQYMFGGYGNDKLIAGHSTVDNYQILHGDMKPAQVPSDHPAAANDTEFIKKEGLPNDGDDLLDLGDTDLSDNILLYGFGQGGNDKILGGAAAEQKLYGGSGDDKIWAVNPGQFQTIPAMETTVTYAYGGNGNDIIYGAPADPSDLTGNEKLFGQDGGYQNSEVDGDDIIYTGNSVAANKGDEVNGQGGNDKLYGQGGANHTLLGESGDDLLVGGEGNDTLFGDDQAMVVWADSDGEGFTNDASVMIGDDTLYGGEGDDLLFAGHGDDYVHGEEGDDLLFGQSGEDTLWGGAGADKIFTGSGWDTVFGGPGCDRIYSEDGGDVIWGGDCKPADTDEANFQWFSIHGTGADKDNFTVIMDFWHETAMPYNFLCLYASARQGIPGAGECSGVNDNFTQPPNFDGDDLSCMTAGDIMSARAPEDGSGVSDPHRTRGSGCKNDGGPLWITVEIVDSEDDITNAIGGGDMPRTLWGRIFQKKQAKQSRRRSRRGSRYAQVGGDAPSESKSDLEECMALQICDVTGGSSSPVIDS